MQGGLCFNAQPPPPAHGTTVVTDALNCAALADWSLRRTFVICLLRHPGSPCAPRPPAPAYAAIARNCA
eukprot:7751735-Pyramimonas_sp.AAC.1